MEKQPLASGYPPYCIEKAAADGQRLIVWMRWDDKTWLNVTFVDVIVTRDLFILNYEEPAVIMEFSWMILVSSDFE